MDSRKGHRETQRIISPRPLKELTHDLLALVGSPTNPNVISRSAKNFWGCIAPRQSIAQTFLEQGLLPCSSALDTRHLSGLRPAIHVRESIAIPQTFPRLIRRGCYGRESAERESVRRARLTSSGLLFKACSRESQLVILGALPRVHNVLNGSRAVLGNKVASSQSSLPP